LNHLDTALQKELHTPAEAGIVKLFRVTREKDSDTALLLYSAHFIREI
jgi:hypothetical protein